jgi:maleate isomerase
VWNPDGWEARTRIGVLTPHADGGPESELQAMSPPDVTIHAALVHFRAVAAGAGMDPTIPLAPQSSRGGEKTSTAPSAPARAS